MVFNKVIKNRKECFCFSDWFWHLSLMLFARLADMRFETNFKRQVQQLSQTARTLTDFNSKCEDGVGRQRTNRKGCPSGPTYLSSPADLGFHTITELLHMQLSRQFLDLFEQIVDHRLLVAVQPARDHAQEKGH